MQRIHTKGVLLGGLVAGLITNVGEFAIEPLLGGEMESWLASLGATPPGEAVMIGFAMIAFALGAFMVWLYAALQPRFSAGVRTALLAAGITWALSCLLPNLLLDALLGVPTRLFWIWTVGPAVEVGVAAVAGAAIYRRVAGVQQRTPGAVPSVARA